MDYSSSWCSFSSLANSPEGFLAILDPKTQPMYTQHELLSKSWMKTGIKCVKLIKLIKAMMPKGMAMFLVKYWTGFYYDGTAELIEEFF